jgi:hypothetical protein
MSMCLGLNPCIMYHLYVCMYNQVVNDSTSCCMRSICVREDDSFLHIGAVLKKFMWGRQ